MKNYESEFSGIALAAYRAATDLTENGCTRLFMAFDFYGLNASEPARSKEADANGSTLLSRIIETVSSRFASQGEGFDIALVKCFRSVLEMFIDNGFDFGARQGKPGARVLWAFLHCPHPFFIDLMVGKILKAGAKPTVPLPQSHHDHCSNALEYAKGQFTQVYKKRGDDFTKLSCWYSIYMKLLAVVSHETGSNEKVLECRPLEMVSHGVLKSVSFVPEFAGGTIETPPAINQTFIGAFQGWIHLVFEDFDSYVNVWTGALTHVKPIGYRDNPETDISGFFQDYIGREAIDFERGYLRSRARFLGIHFDGGKILAFQGDASNPFSLGKEEVGMFFLCDENSTSKLG